MPVPTLLLVLLVGCTMRAATHVKDSTAPEDSGDTSSDSGDGDTDPVDTGDTQEPYKVDDDGDGYSEVQGDCNDADSSVHPGASDLCNLVDDDCDTTVDEDAAGTDPYEPNETSPTYLGNLEEDPNLSIAAWLHNNEDVDFFSFDATAHWYETFSIDVTVSNVPDTASYSLILGRFDESGAFSSLADTTGSGTLNLSYTGPILKDDVATYGLILSALGGADCTQSYLLTIAG